MPTTNEILRDAAIGHAVDLTHHSNGVVRRMMSLLNRVDIGDSLRGASVAFG